MTSIIFIASIDNNYEFQESQFVPFGADQPSRTAGRCAPGHSG